MFVLLNDVGSLSDGENLLTFLFTIFHGNAKSYIVTDKKFKTVMSRFISVQHRLPGTAASVATLAPVAEA